MTSKKLADSNPYVKIVGMFQSIFLGAFMPMIQ